MGRLALSQKARKYLAVLALGLGVWVAARGLASVTPREVEVRVAREVRGGSDVTVYDCRRAPLRELLEVLGVAGDDDVAGQNRVRPAHGDA